MPRHKALDEILSLDPQKDHLRIVYLMVCYEFPFDLVRSGEFALFRTYAVPSVSALLDSTGEFYRRTRKRYDDTDLLLSELYEHGYDSERGRAALRRMNQMHGRFNIANDDMRYVLSTFIYEQVRWNARYGWRPFTDHEKQALYSYWCEVGRRMNIADIPDTYEAFEQYNVEYEREHFQFADTNRMIGERTRDLFLSWVLPRPLFGLGAPFVYAMMDDSLLQAFQFPAPPAALRWLVQSGLKLRARFVALLPERRKPFLRTALRRSGYPQGYQIEDLGY
jgi:hypothetical protein